MGLINKEELLKKIGEHKITDSMKASSLERVSVYEWTKHDLYNIIYNFPTVDDCDKQQWISASERLPDNQDSVLVVDNDYWIDVGYYQDGGGWHYTIDGNLGRPNVVAWMPLPTPPYMGENGWEK